MKLIHLSDLHLGKRVNGFSMTDDQKYILEQILDITADECPDGVMICGDVYDKSVPSAEAVEIFDDFLVRLADLKVQVFIISGNHDSPERLSFGGRIFDRSGIHIAPVYNGQVAPFFLEDEYGKAGIYMLPFIKPSMVRGFFPDEKTDSYTDAVRCAVKNIHPDLSIRNILLTHQFVTGAQRSESEEISVGGTDNVDASVFDAFDYVALGHIHGPQNIGTERIRYSGSPLKYSFSEADHIKSVTVAVLCGKGDLNVRTIPLTPAREMREIRGKYYEVTAKSFYENTDLKDSYVHITLTDEDDVLNALSRLRVIYPYLMKLDYDNKRIRHEVKIDETFTKESQDPAELFKDFYKMQNGTEMTDSQLAAVQNFIKEIWEDEA